MPILSKDDERAGYAPGSWSFWRNLAIYFCAFSVIGHWLEIAYCTFMNLFGIVDAESLVWDDPMYPFLVYGVGAAICTIALVPLKVKLIERRKSMWVVGVQFFIITVVVCLLMELAMGFMLNQPNAAGEYPLWDNSQLPFNILSQAWLVNDIALGAVATLYTWGIYPLCEKLLAKIPPVALNAIAVTVVVSFVALCAVKFG